ncbi:multifunctional oxoglutarate decarboxylase/oxoglutarate dehydrogenase thiamine pyrophosphate-binding subunit/dihydrolipoyllysine-residue succinyltransferase subunit [Boudabousia tangfeifanii]|uniref:multifunctional oxoglutarate decarboxylase/oxoglutarate dehydrogenase thiamine pyrophosphate-binding subunit/dihydrolipoyllysine-residue succinyltransferase subunit n=1 Tax=Boudabousia tangfeifanii TaxID=1912795 RepID=UPI003AAC4BB0
MAHRPVTPPPPPVGYQPQKLMSSKVDGLSASSRIADASRSDLPPLPPVYVAPPTSPYAAAHGSTTSSTKDEKTDSVSKLKAMGAAIARNMEASLSVPTATSSRQVPARVMIENRKLINDHLARTTGGKISFTHLIGYALTESLAKQPQLCVRYEEVDGKPGIHHFSHINLGIAVDIPKDNGERTLLVPVINAADTLTFSEFWKANQDLISRARAGKLSPKDMSGAVATLTNPGTIGTAFSVPRLMQGQALIIGVGAMDYPAEWAGASLKQRAHAGVGKILTLTSTYDHRVIQGAASGQLLADMSTKLMGLDGFYERVFAALNIPLEPLEWAQNQDWDEADQLGKSARISELIHAYRSRGHLAADTDPLRYRVRRHPDLNIGKYGLSIWDLDHPFPTGGFGGKSRLPLRDILDQLRDTYSRTAGIEYMHIQDPTQREWMQKIIEQPYEKVSSDHQRRILRTLNHAEAFETFLQTKYMGQKRFSLEGGESLIPLLDNVLYHAANDELEEVAIGMAHRGRLNVLANICGKNYGQIFSEFEGNIDPSLYEGSGDVKYHLGTEGVFNCDNGKSVKVYLAANPSHLEAADGVLEGIARAKADRINSPADILPILIHGDAAFIGQGVVYETLNMSQLKAYHTGGTIHVIVNNQIGFTTGPTSARSTNYCTDLAKGLQVPIFHVNADDPEMVVRIAHLAYAFRREFHKDVIIDLVCYRRRGHNEGDDPSMTQPIMYSQIDALPSTREVYTRNLIGRGDITEAEAIAALDEYRNELNRILEETRANGGYPQAKNHNEVAGIPLPQSQSEGSGVVLGWTSNAPRELIERVGEAHINFPEGFTPHPKMVQLLQKRRQMTLGEAKVDWGFAELLAFGTLLLEGTPVRMSGEDSRRGTFVQRHAVLHDLHTGQEWTPLANLSDRQAPFMIYDSSLSEYAPLAFEYGYSVESPDSLVLWEAQFGDFANGAQTVMDEFVSSAEQKWRQRSSLVMLLPHGFEGQGPDHSSARIERYLQLCAQNNMRVTQPSTPANYFHLLREQAYQQPRKPLIVFTPKQLLRLAAAQSDIAEFTTGQFKPVLDEVDQVILNSPEQVTRVLLCTGRLYYDLVKERKDLGDNTTAIIRIEQLYPLPLEEIKQTLAKYSEAELVWVQDEPRNQGAWPFMALNLAPELGGLSVVSRPEMASTSAGTMKLHQQQARTLLAEAFNRV